MGNHKAFAQKGNEKGYDLWENVLNKQLESTKNPEKRLMLQCAIAKEMVEYDNVQAYNLVFQYITEAKNNHYKKALTEAYLTLGEIFRLRGRTHQARETYEKALSVALSIKDYGLVYKAKKEIGNILGGLTRYADAQKLLEETLNWYEKNEPNGREYAITINYLAINTLRQGRYKQALEYSQQAKKSFEGLNDFGNQVRMLNNVALIEKNMGFKNEALEKYLKALKLQATKKENHRQMIVLLLNLGNLYLTPLDTLNFSTIENSYQKALKIAHTIKDTMQIVAMHEAMAKFYAMKDDIDKVNQNFEKGYFYIQQTQNYLEEGYYLLRVSDAYMKLKHHEQAIKNAQKALSSFQEKNTEEAIIQALGKLATFYTQKQAYAIAQKYALDAWERAGKNNNQILPYLYVNILENYIELQEYEKGEKWGEMAEKNLLDDNVYGFLPHIYHKLYELNIKRKNYEKSVYWHEKFHEAHQKVHQQERLKNMQEMQALYNFQTQDKENDFLKKINEIDKKQLKQNNIIIFIMSILLFVVVVIGYFFYQNGKKLKKAMQIIQQNNDEITAQNNEIQTQKEHLSDAMDDLSKLNQTLSQKNDDLQDLNEVKTRIFSMISHDMRNPLGNLKAVLELSLSGNLPENEQKFLFKRLAIDVDRVYDFLNTLLFWAKSQMEGFYLQETQMHAHTQVEKLIHITENQANQKYITLQNQASIDVLLTTDKDVLNVVLLNLITNAIKFTKKGGDIVINTSIKDKNIIFAIKDNGIGIPLEHQHKVFGTEKFTTYGTGKEKGSGFGLSLCKDFVQLLGGKIYFESVENQGTTFFVEIPQNINKNTEPESIPLHRTLENN